MSEKGIDTTDQLRKKIDRGETADKAPFPDPAAAPLGTDAEAAGHPPTREELRLAEAGVHGDRAHEPAKRTDQPVSAGGDADTGAGRNRSGMAGSLLIPAVVLIAVLFLFWIF